MGSSQSHLHPGATIASRYRIASRTLSLPSACALPCCPRQDKIETGLSGIQTVKDDEEGGKGGKKQIEEYRRCPWGKQNQREC